MSATDELFKPFQWSRDYQIVLVGAATVFEMPVDLTGGVQRYVSILIDRSNEIARWGFRFFPSFNEAASWTRGANHNDVADFSYIDMGVVTGMTLDTSIDFSLLSQAWDRFTGFKST